jgi:hypothetical protein
MRKFILILICICLFVFSTNGQSVTGTIVSQSSKERIEAVNVFINNSSYQATSDSAGNYILNNIKTGKYTLILSRIGFKTKTQTLDIMENKKYILNFEMVADEKALEEIKVKAKRDKSWERIFGIFEKQFLGEGKPANYCKIINSWVIEFKEQGNQITAEANVPLEIDNQYLGYKINYILKNFMFDGTNVTYAGYVNFSSYFSADSLTNKIWKQNRQKAYYSSDTNFYRALLSKTTEKDAYEGYQDKPGEDPNQRSPYFHQNQSKKMQRISFDTLTEYNLNSKIYTLRIPRRIEVHHPTVEDKKTFYKDKIDDVAWIESKSGIARFNSDGVLLNPNEFVTSGYLAEQRVATMLPLDFNFDFDSKQVKKQNKPIVIDNWIEKPFFVTDKSYYYPKDTISFTGVMYYVNPAYADSLSEIIHIELVDVEGGKVLSKKKIKLLDRSFDGKIPLTDDYVSTKALLLRAYTSWMRNFDDSCYTYRWIPILNESQRIKSFVSSNTLISNFYNYNFTDSLLILSPKKYDLYWGIISIVEANANEDIYPSGFKFSDYIDKKHTTIRNRSSIEKGVSLTGVIDNYKHKSPLYVILVLARKKLSYYAAIDKNGKFSFSNVLLEGIESAVFSFVNEKGKTLELSFKLIDTVQHITWTPAKPLFSSTIRITTDTSSVKWNRSETLKEVVIKAKKAPKPLDALYNTPDYVISAKELFDKSVGTNILTALQGRVPGINIVEMPDEFGFSKLVIRMRGGNTAGGFVRGKNPQPLVLVDGVPFNDVNQLQAIPPSQVERIEVVNRAESMLGIRGYVGVISIITKMSLTNKDSVNPVDSRLTTKVITGYEEPSFLSKSNTIIHWGNERNASLKVNLPKKKAHYLIVAEGILNDGTPYKASMPYEVK